MKISIDKSRIGKFRIKKDLLIEALTHPNYAYQVGSDKHFERLEFLGDAVLDLIAAEWLINNIPSKVGTLSKIRALLVQGETLAELASTLGIQELLRVEANYNIVPSDLEDSLEAVFGAVYLSKGIKGAKKFFKELFSEKLQEIKELSNTPQGLKVLDLQAVCEKNPINELQEFCQKNAYPLPEYDLIKRYGPDHNPTFIVRCTVRADKEYSDIAQGKSIKSARKQVATKILEKIDKNKRE